jgi:hypothetical protein
MQEAIPQAVVAAAFSQAPRPSQLPVKPHGGFAVHRPCGSAVPAGAMGAHAPSLPATLQASQTPHADEAQQTSSTHELPVVHRVPVARVAQPPRPSQRPVAPQVPGPESAHVPAGSAPPGGTAVQVPIVSGSAHDVHGARQPMSQQTPWAQFPVAHSPVSEQRAPGSFLPHVPPLHTNGGAQWLSEVQAS